MAAADTFSFDHIADISLEKDEKLMKIMVVTLEFPALPGGEIEKAEICIQITGFWRQLLLIFHSGSFQASGILGKLRRASSQVRTRWYKL